MSFILDALRKVQEERAPGHLLAPVPKPPRRRPWPWVVAGLAVGVAAGLGGWWAGASRSDRVASLAPPASPAGPPAAVPPAARAPFGALAEPGATTVEVRPLRETVQEPAALAAPAESPSPEPPVLAGVETPTPPPAVGQGLPVETPTDPATSPPQLPSLEISAHVYGADPTDRFVFIGGRILREGDRLDPDGPVLAEITPDGVVLDAKGRRTTVRLGGR